MVHDQTWLQNIFPLMIGVLLLIEWSIMRWGFLEWRALVNMTRGVRTRPIALSSFILPEDDFSPSVEGVLLNAMRRVRLTTMTPCSLTFLMDGLFLSANGHSLYVLREVRHRATAPIPRPSRWSIFPEYQSILITCMEGIETQIHFPCSSVHLEEGFIPSVTWLMLDVIRGQRLKAVAPHSLTHLEDRFLLSSKGHSLNAARGVRLKMIALAPWPFLRMCFSQVDCLVWT